MDEEGGEEGVEGDRGRTMAVGANGRGMVVVLLPQW